MRIFEANGPNIGPNGSSSWSPCARVPNSRALRLVLGIVWVSLAACGRPSKRQMVTLAGQWQADFSVDSASQLPNSATGKRVSLSLDVLPTQSNEADSASPARIVHAGSWHGDFTTLGFSVRGHELLAWRVGDQISLILDPSVDHGHVDVRGRLAADTIVARWALVSDPAQAAGEVRMVRGKR